MTFYVKLFLRFTNPCNDRRRIISRRIDSTRDNTTSVYIEFDKHRDVESSKKLLTQ